MHTPSFQDRHIGVRKSQIGDMLHTIGVPSVDELINQTVPDSIRTTLPALPEAMTEHEYLQHIQALGHKNQVFKSYIGLGYHESITSSAIRRHIFENAGWYTAYTPYQAEIAQGRLEALLNYQTMIADLTGMPMANASMLDEGTAAAEAMTMLFALRSSELKAANACKFLVSEGVLPQTVAVLQTKAAPLGIEIVVAAPQSVSLESGFFGQLLQYPEKYGRVVNWESQIQKAAGLGVKTAVAADILSLVLLKSPGAMGADVVVGSTQRFGIPLGYGGPHAAFFATREDYKRQLPGRIIGLTKDLDGNPALRMALQTREQHIKRDKATSNICTAQVLLAVMAGMYAVWHGPDGLKSIALKVHGDALRLNNVLKQLGIPTKNDLFFDTLHIQASKDRIKPLAEAKRVNFYYIDGENLSLSLNETVSEADFQTLVSIFEAYAGKAATPPATAKETEAAIPLPLQRQEPFLQAKVFSAYHSETDLMRYIKKLERKDLSLNHSMIALGSCTMKLTAASEILPLGSDLWANIHPFAPKEQALGYTEVLASLERYLAAITGFKAASLQPNSGAQGEYAGLMVIRSYHLSTGEGHRDVCLIPASAHGTNPASAVLAGMKVVVIKTTDKGNIDMDDLKEKAEQHSSHLAALMITYPSTHGVFESGVSKIVEIIHQHGGQVYMDGANMNAQVGLTSPAKIGADLCHLNLHKTFAIPHGGGGPGVGPICVAPHLEAFLPGNPFAPEKPGIQNAISSAPFGSAFVCLISYAYISMLGAPGLTKSTEMAILNANYMKSRLEPHFDILYTGENHRVAHEMIVDCRPFKAEGIEVTDIAKRLIDYGFHAPTVSFPVAGTLMIEPTESESKAELDRFCDALISIKNEIYSRPQLLKNAPHTLQMITGDQWPFEYGREEAAFPLDYVRENKFWPAVRRTDEAFGDRNLVCSCVGLEAYES